MSPPDPVAPPTRAGHSPLPWQFSEYDRNDQATVFASDGWFVAVIPHGCIASGQAVMEANASLIVTAVNAHDALVAALREFVGHYPSGINPYLDAAWNAARAALDLARGQP